MILLSRCISVWFAVLVSVPAVAQKPSERMAQPPPPPDVQRTVNAIAGKWSGQLTAKVGGATETFNWTMDCKAVALGAGAACSNGGKASFGVLAESCLLAYDPEGKAVHYMCVTSSGEVHDHKGRWRDDKTVEFEPLQAGLMGKPITETIRWYFPDANTITKSSVVTMPDGSSMVFEFSGKRERQDAAR